MSNMLNYMFQIDFVSNSAIQQNLGRNNRTEQLVNTKNIYEKDIQKKASFLGKKHPKKTFINSLVYIHVAFVAKIFNLP